MNLYQIQRLRAEVERETRLQLPAGCLLHYLVDNLAVRSHEFEIVNWWAACQALARVLCTHAAPFYSVRRFTVRNADRVSVELGMGGSLLLPGSPLTCQADYFLYGHAKVLETRLGSNWHNPLPVQRFMTDVRDVSSSHLGIIMAEPLRIDAAKAANLAGRVICSDNRRTWSTIRYVPCHISRQAFRQLVVDAVNRFHAITHVGYFPLTGHKMLSFVLPEELYENYIPVETFNSLLRD